MNFVILDFFYCLYNEYNEIILEEQPLVLEELMEKKEED